MFLHKQGCNYYIAVFKNLDSETARAIGNNNNRFIVRQCISFKSTNPLPYLNELSEHVKNVEAHISSEENVLKGFVNKLHTITFIDMKKQATSPEFAALTKIISQVDSLEEYFHRLNSSVQTTLDIIEQSKDASATKLIDQYREISHNLTSVFDISTTLANDLHSFAQSIQKEKELIQKEEQAVTDFNKNLMSWF